MQTFKAAQIETLMSKYGHDLTLTYFIRDGDSGPIKIGKSTIKQFKSRLTGLQIGNPNRLIVVGVIVGDCEKEVHETFRQYRISGEWFKPNANLVSYIAEHRERLPRVF
jgi:hypothetical protein